MRSTEDINYEYIQTELVVKFFMEKLSKLDKEYQEAYEREEKLANTIKEIKKRNEVYIKGIKQTT